MNIYEDLNNQLKPFLEDAQIIDFNTYKKEKEGKDTEKDFPLHVEISYVKAKCETSDGYKPFENVDIYHAKDIQARFQALNELCSNDFIDKPLNCHYKVGVTYKDGDEEFVSDFDFNTDLAEGNGAFVIAMAVESAIEQETGKLSYVVSKVDGHMDISNKDILNQRNLIQKERADLKRKPKNTETGLYPAKDYSENKTAQDVEVGDVLYSTNPWGHTSHTFYKVIERKGSLIKLSQLEKHTELINDDNGNVVPTKVELPDDTIDNKRFKIHQQKSDDDNFVCRLNKYTNCYYWDGKPKHETYMD